MRFVILIYENLLTKVGLGAEDMDVEEKAPSLGDEAQLSRLFVLLDDSPRYCQDEAAFHIPMEISGSS